MKALSLVLFLLLSIAGFSQEYDTLPGSWELSVKGQYGFIIAHRPTMANLQQHHTGGLELEWIRPLCGDQDWQQPFLLPKYSIAYQYIYLGNKEQLGNGHALTARLIFPLKRRYKINPVLSTGFGIGYTEKKYERHENYKNVAIGSNLNAVVSFSYRVIVSAGRKSSVDAGISFTHFSNGSFRPPNLGINIPAVQVGYSRFLSKEKLRCFRPIPPVDKKFSNKLELAAGIKGVELPEGLIYYGVTGLSVSRSKTISRKSRLGLGADLFYDRSLNPRLSALRKEPVADRTSFRTGIFARYELTAGRISLLFQNGIYLMDYYKEDGVLYTKVGVDYRITNKLSACFHLKSHYAKADYFEYGMGYLF